MSTEQPPYSDSELFLFIRSGKKKDFELVYNKFSPIVYGFLIYSGLSERYSEELLQQTFVAIWNKSVYTISNQNLSFLTWILQTTAECIIEYLESHGHQFIIHFKNNAMFSIEFTDDLQKTPSSVCIA